MISLISHSNDLKPFHTQSLVRHFCQHFGMTSSFTDLSDYIPYALGDAGNNPPWLLVLLSDKEQNGIGFGFLYGLSFAKDTPKTWYFRDFYVQESLRGQGWGKAMFLRLCEFLQNQGAEKVACDVMPQNPKGRDFFLGLGFRSVGSFALTRKL